jgi:hypothetical protein
MGLALRVEEDQTRLRTMAKRELEAEQRARRERLKDPKMKELGALLGELADERCGPNADFETRSRAAREVFEFLVAEYVDPTDGEERENPED